MNRMQLASVRDRRTRLCYSTQTGRDPAAALPGSRLPRLGRILGWGRGSSGAARASAGDVPGDGNDVLEHQAWCSPDALAVLAVSCPGSPACLPCGQEPGPEAFVPCTDLALEEAQPLSLSGQV